MAINSEENKFRNKETSPDKEGEVQLKDREQYQTEIDRSSKIFLQEIVLENFLSFQYDVIEFDPKFSIVTGPNGAGKSSIYQALKFALGSNDYDGRYSKWSSFIRRGESYTRVRVTFSNLEEKYVIERSVSLESTPKYSMKSPQDEKLKRTNYTQIKKFKETFRIDPDDVFSFMSQGNIDSIKDFKEEVLCNFVEQGIGIDIVKHRILNQKENIVNLNKEYDSLNVKRDNLSYQLAELGPKLQKLKEKKKIEKNLQDLEIELIIAQHMQIQQQLDEINLKLSEFRSQKNDFQQDLDEILEDKAQNKSVLDELNSKYMTIEVNITKSTEQLKIINEKISEGAKAKEQLAQQIEKLKNQIKELEKLKKINEVKQVKVKENLVIIEKNIASHEEEINDFQNQYEKIQKTFLKEQDKIREYDLQLMKIENGNKDLEQLSNSHIKLEKEINDKAQNIIQFDKNLQKYKWFLKNPTTDYQQKMEKYQKEYQKAIMEISDKLGVLKVEHDQLLKKIENLKHTFVDKSLPKPIAIQRMLEEIKKRNLNCIGPLIDFIHYDEIYRLAVESIFGSRILFSFIAKDSEAFRQLKEIAVRCSAKCNIYKAHEKKSFPTLPKIESNNDGIFGYLAQCIKSINPDQDITKVIYSVANQLVVVKDHIHAMNFIKHYNYRYGIVTLDGEQIRTKKYVLESRPYITNKTHHGVNSIAQAKLKINELYNLENKNRESFEEYQNRQMNIMAKKETIQKRLGEIGQLLAIYKNKEITTRFKNKDIATRQKLYQQIQELKKNNDLLVEQKVKLQESLPEDSLLLQQKLTEIPKSLKKYNDELKQYQTTKNNFMNEKMESKGNQIKFTTQIEIYSKESEKMLSDLQKKDASFYKAFQESMKLKEEITKFKDEKQDIQAIIKNEEEKYSILDGDISKLEKEIKNLNSQITDNDFQRVTLEKRLNLISINLTQPEKLKKPIREIDDINAEISIVNGQLRKYQDITDVLLVQKEKISDQIQKIGIKREEIKEEINAAKKANEKLENTYYSRFKEALIGIQLAINKKLKIAGINYQTSLNLNGNIHNMGLEIITTNQTSSGVEKYPLNALSGGQKSMIGICLMLSLNTSHPSPLNMYDECDMFLDEKNAETVAKLIQAVAESGIQFIMLMPSKNNVLLGFSDKVIGISRNGEDGPSTVHYGRIYHH